MESPYPDILQKLLKDPVIQQCRLKRTETEELITAKQDFKGVSFGQKSEASEKEESEEKAAVPDDITKFYDKIDDEEEEEISMETVSFEVNQEKIEVLQKRCIEIDHPLLAEYDFRNDTINKDINIDLKVIFRKTRLCIAHSLTFQFTSF